MNAKLVALTLATLMVFTSAQMLDLSCSGICNGNCQAADVACRLVPGAAGLCDQNNQLCTETCTTTCTCFDDCMARCQADSDNCVAAGAADPIVDTLLCGTTAVQCKLQCPVSCGVQANSKNFNALIQTILPAPAKK